MSDISAFLTSRIEAGDFPSAVYLVAEKGEIRFQDALGLAVVDPEPITARIDTIYDLASLTKVLVTGLIAAELVQSGMLAMDEPVSRYLPQFDTDEKRGITAGELAAHCSGLTGWLPLYLLTGNRSEIIDIIGDRPSEARRGARVIYSDLNFLALEAVIGTVTGTGIAQTARERIFEPLELASACFSPAGAAKRHIAASEMGNRFEKQTCIELGYLDQDRAGEPDPRFRDHLIWGEVHDGNAWFLGGGAGHAGLFSTVEDVYKIALQFLPAYSQLFSSRTCELFRRNLTSEMNEHRSLAFQLASTPESTAGPMMPAESFGHLGFTGTSLWIDPVNERIFILLTNRTHDRALPFANINGVRRRFHDLAIGALEEIHSN